MRLGVLDVGSNTVHLLVVDAHLGAHPWAAHSLKVTLRLAEQIGRDGTLSDAGADALIEAITAARSSAENLGTEDLLAFATSAVRDAKNSAAVLARVRKETGVELRVLSGEGEARMTFLAVRRWFGWSAGRLLVLDIGGGSLEMASGFDEMPEVARSLPFGAARLTREWFEQDPPDEASVRALRRHVRAEIGKVVGDLVRYGRPDRVCASSKTFKQLARMAGAAPSAEGLYVPRRLFRADLSEWIGKLARMPSAERATLPGVSVGRARQLLAGAIVAEAAIDLFEAEVADISPWALREGIILRRLDELPEEWL